MNQNSLPESSSQSLTKLGVLAGQGDLPVQIVKACQDQGRSVFVLGFSGQFKSEFFAGVEYDVVPLGAVQKAIDTLKNHGCEELVMAGQLKRPSLFNLKLDGRGKKIVAKVGLGGLGDDKLLRALIEELESEGFRVVGSNDVLNQSLTVKSGVLTQALPDAQAQNDIEVGLNALHVMAPLDIGQAIIVQQGIVIGVEAVEGTDALIQRYAYLRKEGPAGVLVKAMKQSQEARADLPTIGPETVKHAITAGLCGIAISAHTTQILDQDQVIDLANQHNMFITTVETYA